MTSSTARFERISVIGLGYVGLPTAATIAARGVKVIGVDLNADVVSKVNKGLTHIIEPDLDIIVHSVVNTGYLKAVTKPEPADAFIIAVPTPVLADHAPDMRAVEAAVASIAPVLAKGNLVIIESTSPVGTTQRAAEQLRKLRPDLKFPDAAPNDGDISMAYCPERILPGSTVRELTQNARLVGGLDANSARHARDLYSIFVQGEIHLTTAPVAEMSKLSENAFRDVNIAFANELSLICADFGIDVWEVIRLANLHPRVKILSPGPGVGGHCIPVDPWFIVHSAPEIARLIRSSREVNIAKEHYVCEQVRRAAAGVREPRIAVLGLSYKPNIDDLRESPAVAITEELIKAGIGELYVVEPMLESSPKALSGQPNVHWSTAAEAIAKANVVVVLVAHDAFQAIDQGKLKDKIVIDTVGIWGAGRSKGD